MSTRNAAFTIGIICSLMSVLGIRLLRNFDQEMQEICPLCLSSNVYATSRLVAITSWMLLTTMLNVLIVTLAKDRRRRDGREET